MDFSIVKELESRYDLRGTGRRNICITGGKGCRLSDSSAKSYLDLTAGQGENCFGYGDKRLISAINAQSEALISSSNKYYNALYGGVLNKLIDDTGFTHAAMTGSGVESNLFALSLINSYVNEKSLCRRRVVVVSAGKVSPGAASAKSAVNVNLTFQRVEMNDFSALRSALTEDTAALIIEPISDICATVADYDYLINAYALSKSMDILLMSDETASGIGRTGTRYAYEAYGIQPDIVTLGRGLGGGIPCGAVLTRGAVTECYKPQGNGLDEGGNFLLSCAAVEAVLDALTESNLKEISDKGAYLNSKLCRLSKHNFVLDIRGKGLFAAVELSGRISAARVAGQMEKAGFLIGFTEANIIKITPPFIITKAEIDAACDALAAIFAKTNV